MGADCKIILGIVGGAFIEVRRWVIQVHTVGEQLLGLRVSILLLFFI